MKSTPTKKGPVKLTEPMFGIRDWRKRPEFGILRLQTLWSRHFLKLSGQPRRRMPSPHFWSHSMPATSRSRYGTTYMYICLRLEPAGFCVTLHVTIVIFGDMWKCFSKTWSQWRFGLKWEKQKVTIFRQTQLKIFDRKHYRCLKC